MIIDLMVILMFAEFSGIMALWGFIEYIKQTEKLNPKSRVNTDQV